VREDAEEEGRKVEKDGGRASILSSFWRGFVPAGLLGAAMMRSTDPRVIMKPWK